MVSAMKGKLQNAKIRSVNVACELSFSTMQELVYVLM